ncbi:MAG: glycosyltransferase family 2 protein [Xanthomonadaceae bacterium]|nr:glycosyltransferase family 2 protein [Xanthomonadaceae bacterium]
MPRLLREPLRTPASPGIARVSELYYQVLRRFPHLNRLYAPAVPAVSPYAPVDRTSIEIVSHCWRYATLLTYQLSSLVRNPPRDTVVTMTVFHAAEDDATCRVLEYFGRQQVPNVLWNWRPLTLPNLMRRAIGRNLAALESDADWVFFTDCDVLFGEGVLDRLGRMLVGRDEVLFYPGRHLVTPLLPGDHPMFTVPYDTVVEVPEYDWIPDVRDRATGPFQITRGDVARALGYCGTTGYFQRPAARWRKAREDCVFRWLLGTQGTPLEIEGFYRIRHKAKGRKGATFEDSAA